MRNLRLLPVLALLALVSVQAGSLEPPPGPVSPTRPPDTCFNNSGFRFVDCGDGTIKDRETGLYWLKDANCLGAQDWAAANAAAASLAHGQCGLTDGSLPGDWRLPTLECPIEGCGLEEATGEFSTIFAPGCPVGILNIIGTGCWEEGSAGFPGPFNTNLYWSATSSPVPVNQAWCVSLSGDFLDTRSMGNNLLAWPVRGGP